MSASSNSNQHRVLDDDTLEAIERIKRIASGPNAAGELVKLDKDMLVNSIIALVVDSLVTKDRLDSMIKAAEHKDHQLVLAAESILAKNDELREKNATITHLTALANKPIISNGNTVRAVIEEWEAKWLGFNQISWWMAHCSEIIGRYLHLTSVIQKLRQRLEPLEPLRMFREVFDAAYDRHKPFPGSDFQQELASMWMPDSNVSMDDLTLQRICLNAVREHKMSGVCDCSNSVPGKARASCTVCTSKAQEDCESYGIHGAWKEREAFQALQAIEAKDIARKTVKNPKAETDDADTVMDEN